jgi:AraC-like DNA-binding protein
MLYRAQSPSPPLDAFIERLWFCADAPPRAAERILPSGTLELVITLREDTIRVRPAEQHGWRKLSGSVISGTYTRYFAADPRVHAAILGVHFRPGGAFPFLGCPASELADAHVELEDLWGTAAAELRERLIEAGSPDQRFALLEEALLSRLRRQTEPHPAVRGAVEALNTADAQVRIRDLACDLGLSQRRLIQVFSAAVGLTPKGYQQVQRFRRVHGQVRNVPDPDWAAVAADGGYFDQSHLIHEFRRFSGFTPRELQRRSSADLLPSHVQDSE